MRVTLTRKWWHKALGVTRLEVDGKKWGWYNPVEAVYLEQTLNHDPFALSVFLASKEGV